MYHLTG